MAIMPALDVVCASDPRFFKAQRSIQRCRVHNHTVTGFQMRPRGACEVKDKINFVAPVTVPLLIGDIFNPIEVGPGGVVAGAVPFFPLFVPNKGPDTGRAYRLVKLTGPPDEATVACGSPRCP
jgi:hypothetical protein